MTLAHRLRTFGLALLLALAWAAPAAASEIGHFIPGLFNIRDLVVPEEPGFYAVSYQYFYSTDRLNDEDGDEVESVNIHPGPGPGVTLDVNIDVDMFAWAPVLMWSSPWKVLGARYAALAVPSFANASVKAGLNRSTGAGLGRDVDQAQFAFADLYVQPLWLGWNRKHFDAAFGYGFYAPTGKYNVERFDLPIVGTVKVEEADNIGYGFWTHQLGGAATYYPFENRATAFAGALTYEFHYDKEHFDVTPGQDLSLNWGVSQYLPLGSEKLLLEIGPAGYSSWQTTEDHGSDATNDRLDQVHAAGGQIGITYVPWFLIANFHAFGEFHSEDRFQGKVIGFSLAKKFF